MKLLSVCALAFSAAVVAAAPMEEMGDFAKNAGKEWQRAKESVSKWVDRDIEMAPYKVIKETDEYEIREYPARKWVCSTSSMQGAHISDDERSQNFMRLFSYIQGSNKAGMKIKMTSPVTMASMRSGGDDMFQMCFYVPRMHQEDAPASWDPAISMQVRPAMTVIAAREGGWPTADDWDRMAMKLKNDATKNEETGFDFTQYYTAGYDAPMKFWNRRNEVWYMKKSGMSFDNVPAYLQEYY